MCFSATASFGAGIVLSGIGIATLSKKNARSQILFASIPLLFSIQQISEGFLWLALTKPAFAALQYPATYIFLFFAQVLWPVLVPFSINKMEDGISQNMGLKLLMVTGGIISAYLLFCLLNYKNEASIDGYHIAYKQNYPAFLGPYAGLLYVLATIGPSFLSGFRKMWILGITVLISYIITAIFYTNYIVSVWCFFASIVSISIYFILQNDVKYISVKNKPANLKDI